VVDNGDRAYAEAHSRGDLFFKRWTGERFPTQLLQPDSATLALFALIGAAKP
jgi:hypothetical protein